MQSLFSLGEPVFRVRRPGPQASRSARASRPPLAGVRGAFGTSAGAPLGCGPQSRRGSASRKSANPAATPLRPARSFDSPFGDFSRFDARKSRDSRRIPSGRPRRLFSRAPRGRANGSESADDFEDVADSVSRSDPPPVQSSKPQITGTAPEGASAAVNRGSATHRTASHPRIGARSTRSRADPRTLRGRLPGASASSLPISINCTCRES